MPPKEKLFKKIDIIWLIILFIIAFAGNSLLFRSFQKDFESSVLFSEESSKQGIKSVQLDLLSREEFLSKIENNNTAKRVYNLAQNNGFEYVGRVVETTISGANILLADLYDEDGQMIVFDYIEEEGMSKAQLIEVDQKENTLTTYNDAESGLKTDLTSGEIVKSWGPLITHSNEYDFDLDKAKANYLIWKIGLSSKTAADLFELMCGSLEPDNLLDVIDRSFDDPFDILLDYLGCGSYLATIQKDLKEAVKEGYISSYLPDLEFGSDSQHLEDKVVFEWGEPGRFSTVVRNRGIAYSGNFKVILLGKRENEDWREISSFKVGNLRPCDSNEDFPYSTEKFVYFDYSPEEKEVVTVSIDPNDVIDEREEDNNQYFLGRDKLNQKPIASIKFISPNPMEVGQYTTFRGQAIDVDGHIALRGYEWDFGDGTTWRTDATIYYQFQEAGKRTIRLRAQDAEGLWSEWVSYDVLVTDSLNRPEDAKKNLMIHSAFYAPSDKSSGIAFVNNELIVISENTLYKLDPRNGQVLETKTFEDLPKEGSNYLTSDGKKIWLANNSYKKHTIYQVDWQNGVEKSFDFEQEISGIGYKNNQLVISTDAQALAFLDLAGNLISVEEAAENLYGVEWTGNSFWARTRSRIVRLNEQMSVFEHYNIDIDDCPEGEIFLKAPYYPIDFAWDGQYVWVLGGQGREACWHSKKIRQPIIYKIDAQGYRPPYIYDGYGAWMTGLFWDGDGFAFTRRWGYFDKQRIIKLGSAGKYMDHISIDKIRIDYGDIITLSRDNEHFWVLTEGKGDISNKAIKISNFGEILETFDLPSNAITGLNYYKNEWWLASENTIYKTNEKFEIIEEYASPIADLVDLVWANDLWVTSQTGLIYQLKFEENQFSLFAIYAPFGEEYSNGKTLAWDGQYLWYGGVGKLYKMEHIAIRPNSARFFQPILNKESLYLSYGDVSEENKKEVCYLVDTGDTINEHGLFNCLYPKALDKIYVVGGGYGLQVFDGKEIEVIDPIEAVNDRQGPENYCLDLIVLPDNKIFAATNNGVYEYDGWGWYENYSTLDKTDFSACEFSPVSDELFVSGYTWRNMKLRPTVAKYTNGQWDVVKEFSNMDATHNNIFMLSEDLGFLANKEGLYKYNGENWLKVNCQIDHYLGDMFFTSPNNGYIAGEFGFLLYYDGNSCKPIFGLPADFYAQKIQMISENQFLLIGLSVNIPNSLFYYDGFEFKRINLTNIVPDTKGRDFNDLVDMEKIPTNGIAISGYEDTLLICPDIDRLIKTTEPK